MELRESERVKINERPTKDVKGRRDSEEGVKIELGGGNVIEAVIYLDAVLNRTCCTVKMSYFKKWYWVGAIGQKLRTLVPAKDPRLLSKT